jgi:hypothetical protein
VAVNANVLDEYIIRILDDSAQHKKDYLADSRNSAFLLGAIISEQVFETSKF